MSTLVPSPIQQTTYPLIAQTPPKGRQSSPDLAKDLESPWLLAAGVLLLALIGSTAFFKWRIYQMSKLLHFEDFKSQDLKKKLKLALNTISKLETNPDLVHSRDFNLEYLRMRMAEDRFNFAILNQIKIRIKDSISVALRPKQAEAGAIGVSSSSRQIDETFDVEYTVGEGDAQEKRILFRIQIRLVKLPTQATSQTIQQIIDCMEAFMSPTAEDDCWQPKIQGRLAHMEWDQKAKPTPLLVLEQTQDGSNVTFRTRTANVGKGEDSGD
jgi:hypothetical protein